MSPNPAVLTWPRSGVTLTNEIVNGNFEDGTTGWTLYGVEPGYSVSDNVLSFTPNASNMSSLNQHINQPIPLANYETWYLAARYKASSTVALRITTSTIYTPSPGEWVVHSRTYALDGARNFGLRDMATESWAQIQCQAFVAINLTQAFGAGNEPAHEELKNALMASFPTTYGWFGGTATVEI